MLLYASGLKIILRRNKFNLSLAHFALQTEYDLRIAARTLQDRIAPRICVFHQAAA